MKKITNKTTYGITNEQQTNNKQITTNKNDKNIKNEKNKIKEKEKKETEIDKIIKNNFTDKELIETIYEFIKMRKSIKKPLTTRGLELMIKNLNKLSTNKDEQIEILNNSIMNNWQGVYPLKENNSFKNNKKEETFEEQVERYKREWGLEDED